MAINTFNYHEFANAFIFATICGKDHRMIDNISIIPTDTFRCLSYKWLYYSPHEYSQTIILLLDEL